MNKDTTIIMPGEAVGNYDGDWKKTFDLQFLIGWFVLFSILFIVTIIIDPTLFSEKQFFHNDLLV